jgi:pteridine reductase
MTNATHTKQPEQQRVALVTGSAKRLGAYNVRSLHQKGYRVIIHYHHSWLAATELAAQLNAIRPHSAALLCADLADPAAVDQLARDSLAIWQRLDVLVNNASAFYPTPIGTITHQDWLQLFSSNAQAPLFLSQALAPALAEQSGCIVNMTDIHAERPLNQHPVYSMAKSALRTMTLALARELAPHIRVNGIAPGAILWPEGASNVSDATKHAIVKAIPLQRLGSEADIAQAMHFLIEAHYITGQIINVDGGRCLA